MFMEAPLFADRFEAGRRLAQKLAPLKLQRPIVYALPRGGVPVGFEISRALGAPLDLVLVRKIGAPGYPELALGAVVNGDTPQTIINPSVAASTGADEAYLDRVRRTELKEIERRRKLYFGDHPRVSATGRTAIVVDDGLATGATARAAILALRKEGAEKIILAVPVGPAETIAAMEQDADEVICLEVPERFQGVGAFYRDFHQLSDAETVSLLKEARTHRGSPAPRRREALIGPQGLQGDVRETDAIRGLVLFAHGSGSSRLSPRNIAVAEALGARGFATLLFDLLTDAEAQDRRNVFDVELLADRLCSAAEWAAQDPSLGKAPLGLFGASTGAAAALIAAARLGERVGAVVSRGGRPDLAGDALEQVSAPTLLIVGGADHGVIELNQQAYARLRCEKSLQIVPRATHLFPEPGALEAVTEFAGRWFDQHLAGAAG